MTGYEQLLTGYFGANIDAGCKSSKSIEAKPLKPTLKNKSLMMVGARVVKLASPMPTRARIARNEP